MTLLSEEKRLSSRNKICRFSTSKDEYRKTGPEAKPQLFLPPDKGPLELSVFHTTGLDTQAIKQIGEREITNVSKRRVHGHGLIEASDIEEVGLAHTYDDDPEGHVTVTGWSAEKSLRLLVAQKLADIMNKRHASFELH